MPPGAHQLQIHAAQAFSPAMTMIGFMIPLQDGDGLRGGAGLRLAGASPVSWARVPSLNPNDFKRRRGGELAGHFRAVVVMNFIVDELYGVLDLADQTETLSMIDEDEKIQVRKEGFPPGLIKLSRNRLSLIGGVYLSVSHPPGPSGPLDRPYPEDAGGAVHFEKQLKPPGFPCPGTDESGRDI